MLGRTSRSAFPSVWLGLVGRPTHSTSRTVGQSTCFSTATPVQTTIADSTGPTSTPSTLSINDGVEPVQSTVDTLARFTRMTGPVGDYLEAKAARSALFSYGTKTHSVNPDLIFNNPLSVHQVSLDVLLANQTHLGHSTTRWNPATSPYVFGIRDGTHIIALDATATHLRRAARIVSMVSESAGLILFVGTRPGQERSVIPAARMAGGTYLSRKYMPGSLTNRFEIMSHCPLKVVNMFDQEVPEMTAELVNHPPLLPDMIVCLNPVDNYTLLHEAAQMNIPTIGIIDTDANPGWVTYPIPANDDSPRSVQIIAGALGRAAEEGRQKRLAAAADANTKPRSQFNPRAYQSHIVTRKQAARTRASRSAVLDILERHQKKRQAGTASSR